MRSIISFIFFGLVATCPLTSLAKDGVIYKSSHGYHFVNGGTGEEQAANIRQIAKNYSLQVVFSLGNAGAWISDARLMILDATGTQTVFSKQQAGPLLYIDLPPGDYQVIGSYNDVRQSKRITLTGEKPLRVILNWKDETEEYSVNSKTTTDE